MWLGLAPESLLPGRHATSFYSGAFLGKNMVYIYGLRCPIDGGFRYIGKTINLKTRLKCHISDAKAGRYKHYAANWIRGVLAQGLTPDLVVLEECGKDTWQQAERNWIAKGKLLGWRLTNSTIGGEGTPELTPESWQRKSTAMKQVWQAAEFRERIVSARNEPEFLKAQAKRLEERWKDENHRKKIQDARWTEEKRREQAERILLRKDKIQRAMTPEARAKQAASLRLNWAKRKEQKCSSNMS